MNSLEMFQQMEEEKGKKGGASAPPISTSSSSLSSLEMFQQMEGGKAPVKKKEVDVDEATLSDFIAPIKNIGKKIGEKIVEQGKKDIGMGENILQQATGFANFHPAMALANVAVSGSNELSNWMFNGVAPTWSSLGERIRNNMDAITYMPRTKAGEETMGKIETVLKSVPIAIDYIDDKTGERVKKEFPNAYAATQTVGEMAPFVIAAKLFHNLTKNGIEEKVAKGVVDKVIPATDELPVPSKGLKAEEIKTKPFNPDGVINDLIESKKGIKEEITTGPRQIVTETGGIILEDIKPKVIGIDIDKVFSPTTGFDAEYVKKWNARTPDDVDLAVGSTHRQTSLLLKDIGDIQEELRTAGVKQRVAAVTPDLGGDYGGTRGPEYLALEKEHLTPRGSKLLAVFDDRADLAELGNRHIKVENGFLDEHFSSLEALIKGEERPLTIQELAQKIKEYDPDLKAHGEHVATIAVKMAKVLGTPENIQHDIMYGSWLHDLGKINIDKKILNKPEKLTPEEFEIVKTHPLGGFAEGYKDKLSPTVMNIIENHHERFDGKGYPNGLKDKEIPIEAQIVSAADVYDALTTDKRSYRKPMSQEELVNTFEKMRGMNFSPEVLDALFQSVGLKDSTLAKKEIVPEGVKERVIKNAIDTKLGTIIGEAKVAIENLSPKENSFLATFTKKLKEERGSFSLFETQAKILEERKKANDRLAEEYKKAETFAKEEKLSLDDWLRTKTDLTEEQIKEFIFIGKDLTSKDSLVARSQTRTIGMIKNALKVTPEELKTINKYLTGIEEIKFMSFEERATIIDGLQFLYKLKNGEEFKGFQKAGPRNRKIKKDVDRAFIENSLSANGLFGIKELSNRAFADGEAYLRSHGPSAKKLAETISSIRINSDLRFAEMAAEKKNFLSKLTEGEKVRVQEIVETIPTSEIVNLPDAPRVKDAAKFIREKFNELSEDMEVNGVKIVNLKGERLPYTHDPEAPHWPRFYNPEELVNPGRKHDAAIKQMVKKGYAETPAQAEVLLDKILSRRMNSPKYGNMEYAREFNIDGYEKDINIVFDNYFKGATKRIEVIKAYGQQGKGVLELLGNIKKESGDYVYKYAIDINKRMMGGNYGNDVIGRAFVDTATSLAVLTKMGRAGVRNLGQSANTIGTSYTKSSLKALGKIFSDPKTAMDLAERSGAMLHSYANDFARFERGQEVSIGFMKVAKIARDTADGFLTVSGFKQSEIFNRLFAATTGREYAVDLFRELKNAKPDSRAFRSSSMRLKRLGLDPVELLSKTELTELDRRTASYNFVKETQFINDSMQLPRWVSSENPWIRILTLFKTFGMQQAKLISRTLKTDPIMAGKLLASMTVLGGLTAEGIDLLTAKVRGDETTLEQVSRYLTSGGGFGLWADTVHNAMRSSSGLAEALGGPVIGDVGTKAFALRQGLIDDDWSAFERTMIKDIPIIGPTIYNYNEGEE